MSESKSDFSSLSSTNNSFLFFPAGTTSNQSNNSFFSSFQTDEFKNQDNEINSFLNFVLPHGTSNVSMNSSPSVSSFSSSFFNSTLNDSLVTRVVGGKEHKKIDNFGSFFPCPPSPINSCFNDSSLFSSLSSPSSSSDINSSSFPFPLDSSLPSSSSSLASFSSSSFTSFSSSSFTSFSSSSFTSFSSSSFTSFSSSSFTSFSSSSFTSFSSSSFTSFPSSSFTSFSSSSFTSFPSSSSFVSSISSIISSSLPNFSSFSDFSSSLCSSSSYTSAQNLNNANTKPNVEDQQRSTNQLFNTISSSNFLHSHSFSSSTLYSNCSFPNSSTTSLSLLESTFPSHNSSIASCGSSPTLYFSSTLSTSSTSSSACSNDISSSFEFSSSLTDFVLSPNTSVGSSDFYHSLENHERKKSIKNAQALQVKQEEEKEKEKDFVMTNNNINEENNELILSLLAKKGISENVIHKIATAFNALNNKEKEKTKEKKQNNLDGALHYLNNFPDVLDPEENPLANYSRYVFHYEKFLLWIFNSLDSTKNELLHIAFVVLVQLFVKLIHNEPLLATLFLRRFSSTYKIGFTYEINKLLSLTHPSQLIHCDFLRYKSIDSRHTIYISKRTKKALQTYLVDSGCIVIQNIIQSYIKLKLVENMSDLILYTNNATSLSSNNNSNLLNDYFYNNCNINNLNKNYESIHDINTVQIHWGLPKDLYKTDDLNNNMQMNLHENTNKNKRTRVVGNEPSELVDSRYLVPLPQNNSDVHTYYKNLLKTQAFKRAYVSSSNMPSILCYTLHNSSNITSLCVSQFDGMFVAAAYENAPIKLWNLAAQELLRVKKANGGELQEDDYLNKVFTFGSPEDWSDSLDLVGHDGSVLSLCFGEMNRILLSGGIDGLIRLWCLPSINQSKATYRGGGATVWDIDIAQFGYYFVSGEADRLGRFWCTERSHPLRTFSGHTSDVDKIKIHPNCSLVVTASSNDRTLRLWDVRTSNVVRIFDVSNDFCYFDEINHTYYSNNYNNLNALKSIAVSHNGRLVAAADYNNSGYIWDISMGVELGRLRECAQNATDLDFSYNSNLLAAASSHGIIKFYDVSKPARGESLAVLSAIKKQKKVRTNRKEFYSPIKSYGLRDAQIQYAKFTPENVLLLASVSTQTTV